MSTLTCQEVFVCELTLELKYAIKLECMRYGTNIRAETDVDPIHLDEYRLLADRRKCCKRKGDYNIDRVVRRLSSSPNSTCPALFFFIHRITPLPILNVGMGRKPPGL
jgi:hypothetical protein